MPKVPYPYEVNGKLVTGNGSLIPICSLSNRSLLPSLTVVAFSFLDQCPTDHPFAYNNGNHCCKTKEERLVEIGTTPWWPQSEIDDGTCDGLDFNRQSSCCRDDAYTPCPHTSGCFDNSGGKCLIHQNSTLLNS